MGLERIEVRVLRRIAGDRVGVALDVDRRIPGVLVLLPGAVEGVAGDQPVVGALLDVDALGGHPRPDPVVQHLDEVPRVRTAADAEALPVAVRGAEIDALAEAGLFQAGVVHRGILDHAVSAALAEVHALVADVVHAHAVDRDVLGAVEDDALFGLGDREPLEVPVTRALQPQAVPGLAGRAVRVAGIEQRIGQHRARPAGQRDRRGCRARSRGDELVGIAAVGQLDRVARFRRRERGLELGRIRDGIGRGRMRDRNGNEQNARDGEHRRVPEPAHGSSFRTGYERLHWSSGGEGTVHKSEQQTHL